MMNSLAEQVCAWVWQASWQASLLVLVIAMVVAGWHDRLAPVWRHALWSLVLLRMLLPVTPASPWSLYRMSDWLPMPTLLIARMGQPQSIQADPKQSLVREHSVPMPSDGTARGDDPSDRVSSQGAAPSPIGSPTFDRVEATASIESSAVHHSESSAHRMERDGVSYRSSWLSGIWLMGVIGVVTRAAWLHFRLLCRIAGCPLVNDPQLRDAVTAACHRVGMRTVIDLRITPEPLSPCVVGLLRPTIVLPECLVTDRSPAHLEPILIHELMHLKRRDLWWQALMTLAMAIHWFNPVLRWGLRQMRMEREVDCDERTLVCLPHLSPVAYGQMIVELAQQLVAVPLQVTMIGIFSSSHSLQRRIRLLVARPTARRWPAAVAWCVVVGLACMGLTQAMPRVVAAAPDESAKETAPADQAIKPTAGTEAKRPSELAGFTGDFTLSGIVADVVREDRRISVQPKAHIDVKLLSIIDTDEPPRFLAKTISTADGMFSFSGLAEPNYELRINPISYLLQIEKDGVVLSIGHSAFAPDIMIEANNPRRTLRGRVLDPQGHGVAGARVYQRILQPRPITGLWDTTTDREGHFELPDLPMVEDSETKSLKMSLGVEHPDYVSLFKVVTWSEKGVQITLAPGSSFLGQVIYEATGKPAAGVRISALPDQPLDERNDGIYGGEGYREYETKTDAEGRFVLRVDRGVYHVLAEVANFVAVAAVSREIELGQEVTLPTFRLVEGGIIEGRVIHPRTRQPVVFAPESLRTNPYGRKRLPRRLTLGYYGPAYPRQKNLLSPMPVAMVDERGTFRMRAVPGDNYPYVLNTGANRMMWDTLDQPPVKVEPGRTTTIELTLKIPIEMTDVQSVVAELLDRLPAEREARIAAIAVALRDDKQSLKDELTTARLCALIRDLVQMGPDAIPSLCRVFDKEQNPRAIRAWAFALRAIGDRRAVPSLIRAIPRTLGAPGDAGMNVPDPELMEFMQKHDLGDDSERLFSYGCPIREVSGALRVLTGQQFDEESVAWIGSLYDTHVNTLSQRHLLLHAATWREWWLANGPQVTTDANFYPCELPSVPELPSIQDGARFPVGYQHERTSIGMTLSPPSENGIHLLDLETSFKPHWPAEIPRNDEPATLQQLEAWAAARGIDAMCIEQSLAAGVRGYVVRTLGMTTWRLTDDNARRIDTLAREGKLPIGTPAGALLTPTIVVTDDGVETRPATFLFRTREGTWGTLRLTDQIKIARDITGQLMHDKGVGFYRGVQFNVGLFIDPREKASK